MLSPNHTIRQRVAIVVILTVGLGVLVLISPYMSGLLLALVLHVLVAPIYERLTRYMSPGLASTLVIAGIIVLLVVPSAWLISMVVAQVPDALHGVDTGFLATLRT